MIDENNLLNFHCNGIYDNTKSLTETEIIMKVLEKLNLVILNFNDLENKVLNNVKELDKQVNYYLDTGIKLEVNKQLDDNVKIADINAKVSTNVNNIENVTLQLEDKVDKNEIKDINSQLDTKASKNEIFTMANMGQDIKEAMTGGSVAIVGNNAILSNNILEGQVTPNKTSFFEEKISLVDKAKLQVGGVYFDGTIQDWTQIKYTDYIPVNEGDILNCYYFPEGVKTKLTFRMYCFYDSNYEVVRDGLNSLDCTDLVVPEGVKYVILTIKDVFTTEETFITTKKEIDKFYEYEEKIKEEYLPINPLNNVKIVGKNSKYKTISSALDSIKDDSVDNKYTIIVCPGVYEESVGINGNRHISIIGINKRDCIIKTTTGNYYDAPLEISGNAYVANLTCIASYNTKDEVLANKRPYNYAIHVDMAGEGTCEVYNCDFISYTSSALGLGTLNNQTIKFRDCLFESFTEENFGQSDYGAVFLHSAVDNTSINQRVEINNCIMRSKVENVMYITALENWSSFEVALYNNILFSEVSGKNDTCVKINGTKVNITNDSFGNNVAKINK